MWRLILIVTAWLMLSACGGSSEPAKTLPDVEPPVVIEQPEPTVSEDDAARFLLQASFGPTPQSVPEVVSQGYESWIDAQIRATPSLHLPLLNIRQSDPEVYAHHWVEVWWEHAVYADDQLRQRVAFALSQLFVVSFNDARLSSDPRGMASYYDTLVSGSLGNYRQLLEDVTLHPMMGMYLSMLGNEKPDAARNIRPDENFAREVMQLFTIGLVELNPNGTPRLDSQGQTIATYDQGIIEGFAHVFTGWHFANREHWWDDHYDGTSPMQAYDSFHDEGEKQLLNDRRLPANQTGNEDLQAALDNLFAHPNVAPFVSKHLIQRLVTSNPSPDYVERVAAVFSDNGAGVRGDLAAVVKAVLLDPEARSENTTTGDKLRMPLLRIAHLLRVFDSRARDGGMGHEFVAYHLGVAPLHSPSVFNFYRPDYSLPGDIRNAGLVSPEFQIENEISVTRYINTVFHTAWFNNQRNDIVEDDVGILNFDRLVAMADDHEALLDFVDLYLLAGRMDDMTRGALSDALTHWQQGSEGWMKLANLVYLSAISPQFAVQ